MSRDDLIKTLLFALEGISDITNESDVRQVAQENIDLCRREMKKWKKKPFKKPSAMFPED